MGVVGDVRGDLPSGGFRGAAIVALAESGNNRSANVAGAGIVDDGFKAVADFNAIFAIGRSEEKQDAAIIFFGADAELFVDGDGGVFNGFAVERFDSDDGDLGASFLLDFEAESFEFSLGRGVDDASEIGDIAGRLKIFEVVGARENCCAEKQAENGEEFGEWAWSSQG